MLPEVELGDAECDATLDFLRTKGTELLREITGNPSAILAFEYGFTPNVHLRANFHKKNVEFGEVLLEVLPQFGLSYKVVGLDRIVILDVPDKAKSK